MRKRQLGTSRKAPPVPKASSPRRNQLSPGPVCGNVTRGTCPASVDVSGWHSYGGIGGAYATSWRYRPHSHGWAPAIPRNGIVVNVFFVAGKPPYPPLRLVIPAKASTFLRERPTPLSTGFTVGSQGATSKCGSTYAGGIRPSVSYTPHSLWSRRSDFADRQASGRSAVPVFRNAP
jgi:hypothetical protein